MEIYGLDKNKGVVRAVLSALLVCLVVLVFAVQASALPGVETQITTNPAMQNIPAISGNYIVYTDNRIVWGTRDVFLYDITSKTESNLTPNMPVDQLFVDIDGTRVVYTDYTYPIDIYLYDLSTSTRQRLTSKDHNYLPAIQGDHVVWMRWDGTYETVCLLNLKTSFTAQVSDDAYVVQYPRVDGDWVVWEEQKTLGAAMRVWAYQISTGQKRILDSGLNPCRLPDVSGNLVVWQEYRNYGWYGSWEIILYDLVANVERQLTTTPTNNPISRNNPRISGRRVVWEQAPPGGVWQIWTMDIDKGVAEPVSPSGYHQWSPSIDGNRIVWAENRDSSNASNIDIFMFEIGEIDTDGDGVPDSEDACPDENATGFDVNADGCIDSTSGLGTIIAALVQEGMIAPELQTSLMAKIDNAEKSATKDNICAAINQLNALKNQVNAQRGNKISNEAADAIIAYADSVIAYMLSQLPAGQSC